ncbi:hypothetical protein RRG08_007998 [Elysia crispata]|uniref:Uncharacterized protein n=1 Tax=Elysia crispata TaxID=231223 RepID=A0AAE1B1D9_9GAST|nr:hypothetical protein RRG08_007998 [Elysia crispata]
MRLVGAITAMVLLVSVNVSPSIGQDGIFPPSLFPNSPIVSNTESQLNDTQVELDRVSTGFSKLPEQQQPQQPQQPQQSSQQPQQPIQQTFGNQQENRPQYPQAQQPAQIPQYPQQSPTQYPKPQSSQFPQQPQSAQSETRYPEQQTQYSQPSVPSLSLPLSEQISHVDSHNQSSSNAVGTKNNTLTTGTKILDADSQGESKNATTTTTASTTISATTTTTPPEPEKTGMDQKNGEAESLVDYALGLAGYKGDSEDEKDKDKTVSAPATDTASPTPTTSTVSNCNLPASLQSCGMPADVLGYFNYNVSVRGVLASIFRPDIVQMLSQQCEPGSWCLSYDIHLVRKNLNH